MWKCDLQDLIWKKIGIFVMRISKYLSLKILKIIILIINRLRPCALVYIFIFLGDLNFHISKHVSCVSHECLCPMKTVEKCYGIRCVMICYNVVKWLLYGRDVPFDQIGPGISHQPSGRYGIPGSI